MKITQDVREYAEKGMQEKSKEFLEQGGDIYRRMSARRLAGLDVAWQFRP